MPFRYGPRTTVYNRYVRWARRGIWRGIFEALSKSDEESLLFIDSPIIKAHRAATGAKGGVLAQDIGRSRGDRTTKIQAAVDHKGRLKRVIITLGPGSRCPDHA